MTRIECKLFENNMPDQEDRTPKLGGSRVTLFCADSAKSFRTYSSMNVARCCRLCLPAWRSDLWPDQRSSSSTSAPRVALVTLYRDRESYAIGDYNSSHKHGSEGLAGNSRHQVLRVYEAAALSVLSRASCISIPQRIIFSGPHLQLFHPTQTNKGHFRSSHLIPPSRSGVLYLSSLESLPTTHPQG